MAQVFVRTTYRAQQILFGMVLFGMVLFGMVLFGMVLFGMVWGNAGIRSSSRRRRLAQAPAEPWPRRPPNLGEYTDHGSPSA